MSETGVLTFSVAIFLVLGFIIYRLVACGIRDILIDGKRISPFFSFFLDKESLTYSLSKFQLFLFSATFVFGYLYVFLCQWLVQWRFQLPDVPSNIAGLLAISAGTTVAAAGATSARGSKGSGEIYPSPADFISTGGLVVPERFQLFCLDSCCVLRFFGASDFPKSGHDFGVPQFSRRNAVCHVDQFCGLLGRQTGPEGRPGGQEYRMEWD
jgi:hypothetical protein